MTEETLSDKIIYNNHVGFEVVDSKDVREFIRKLKEMMTRYFDEDEFINRGIDKLAGEKLTENKE